MTLGTNWVGPRTGVTPAPGLMTKLNDLREAACLKDTVLCVSVCASYFGASLNVCITSEHGSFSLCVCLSLVSVSIYFFNKYLSRVYFRGLCQVYTLSH